MTTQNKGKGKKSKGYGGKPGVFNKGKSLAEKIATSSCRRCGQVGHWKRECPLAQGQGKGEPKGKSPSGETITLAEALVTYPHDQDEGDHNVNEMMMELPENAENIGRANDHGLGKEEIYFGEHEESAMQQHPLNIIIITTMNQVFNFPVPRNVSTFISRNPKFQTPTEKNCLRMQSNL